MPPPEDIDDCEFDTKDTGQFEEEKKDVTWWTYGGEGSGGGGGVRRRREDEEEKEKEKEKDEGGGGGEGRKRRRRRRRRRCLAVATVDDELAGLTDAARSDRHPHCNLQ